MSFFHEKDLLWIHLICCHVCFADFLCPFPAFPPRRLSAPPGVQAATWWTVDVHPPDPPSIVEVEQQRALEILVRGQGQGKGVHCVCLLQVKC